jgi:hypothetical protein
MKFFYWCEQEIARELAERNPVAPNGVMFLQNQASESVEMSSSVPLLARVHLKLGAWRWHLNSSLDEESIRGNFFLPSSCSIHNIGNHQLLSVDILVNLYLQNPFMCCRILTHCREELSLLLVGWLIGFFVFFGSFCAKGNHSFFIHLCGVNCFHIRDFDRFSACNAMREYMGKSVAQMGSIQHSSHVPLHVAKAQCKCWTACCVGYYWLLPLNCSWIG